MVQSGKFVTHKFLIFPDVFLAAGIVSFVTNLFFVKY